MAQDSHDKQAIKNLLETSFLCMRKVNSYADSSSYRSEPRMRHTSFHPQPERAWTNNLLDSVVPKPFYSDDDDLAMTI